MTKDNLKKYITFILNEHPDWIDAVGVKYYDEINNDPNCFELMHKSYKGFKQTELWMICRILYLYKENCADLVNNYGAIAPISGFYSWQVQTICAKYLKLLYDFNNKIQNLNLPEFIYNSNGEIISINTGKAISCTIPKNVKKVNLVWNNPISNKNIYYLYVEGDTDLQNLYHLDHVVSINTKSNVDNCDAFSNLSNLRTIHLENQDHLYSYSFVGDDQLHVINIYGNYLSLDSDCFSNNGSELHLNYLTLHVNKLVFFGDTNKLFEGCAELKEVKITKDIDTQELRDAIHKYSPNCTIKLI